MKEITRREYLKLAVLATGGLAAGALTATSSTALAASTEETEESSLKENYDALIVGGGPAGLSAALAMGRMMRSALVCDDNRPRNAPSTHLNNFATRDGIHPDLWREEARKNLRKYTTIGFYQGTVASIEQLEKDGFLVKFAAGNTATFRKVILADGIEDQLPAIPGFRELWGKSIFHCPYCHGFEVRGTPLGLVANGKSALHMAPLCLGLSKDLILFTNGKSDLTKEQTEMLTRKGVAIVESKLVGLNAEGTDLKSVVLKDGQVIPRQGLFYARVGPIQTKSNLGETLGCKKTKEGIYKVTERGETTVRGVYAAGDNMSRRQSVLSACGFGASAGSSIVSDLLNEELQR